jgi:hypothetical protein
MYVIKGLLMLSTMAVCVSAFALRQQPDETEAIRQTLQYYLDGHVTGDPEIMAKAFHPTARLQYIRNGEASVRSLESYLGGMSGSSGRKDRARLSAGGIHRLYAASQDRRRVEDREQDLPRAQEVIEDCSSLGEAGIRWRAPRCQSISQTATS